VSKGRDAILASIRGALDAGRAAGWAPPASQPPDFHDVETRYLDDHDPEALRVRFQDRLVKLGDSVRRIRVADVQEEVEAFSRERGLQSGVAEAAAIELTGTSARRSLANDKTTMFAADHALVLADYGVAETGTLVFVHAPGRSRLITIAPPLQLVVLRASTLLPDLVDALAIMRDVDPANSVAWITGSSRTADIDGILIRGAHGPKELAIFMIEDA